MFVYIVKEGEFEVERRRKKLKGSQKEEEWVRNFIGPQDNLKRSQMQFKLNKLGKALGNNNKKFNNVYG